MSIKRCLKTLIAWNTHPVHYADGSRDEMGRAFGDTEIGFSQKVSIEPNLPHSIL